MRTTRPSRRSKDATENSEEAVRATLQFVERLLSRIDKDALLFPAGTFYGPGGVRADSRALERHSPTARTVGAVPSREATALARPCKLENCTDSKLKKSLVLYFETHATIAVRLWFLYRSLTEAERWQYAEPSTTEAFEQAAAAPAAQMSHPPAATNEAEIRKIPEPFVSKESSQPNEATQRRSTSGPCDVHQLARLYEIAQCWSAVCPRLYVLSTVAAALIACHPSRRDEIAQDLLEMLAGVQHPLLSLPLRTFVAKLLVDAWKPQEGATDLETEHLVDHLMDNWENMVDALMRVPSYGFELRPLSSSSARNDLAACRWVLAEQLSILLGSQFTVLARTAFLKSAIFREKMLPMLSQRILRIAEAPLQEYLLECLIQAFPEEFLAFAAQHYLDMIQRTRVGVRHARLLARFWERLHRWLQRSPAWTQAVQDLPLVVCGIEALTWASPVRTPFESVDRLDACEMLVELALKMGGIHHTSLNELLALYLRAWKRAYADLCPKSPVSARYLVPPTTTTLVSLPGARSACELTPSQCPCELHSPCSPDMEERVDLGGIFAPCARSTEASSCTTEQAYLGAARLVRLCKRLVRAAGCWSDLLMVPAFNDLLTLLPMDDRRRLARQLALWIVLDRPSSATVLRPELCLRRTNAEALKISRHYASILIWLDALVRGAKALETDEEIGYQEASQHSTKAARQQTAHDLDVDAAGCLRSMPEPTTDDALYDVMLCSCVVGKFTWNDIPLLDQLMNWVLGTPAAARRQLLPTCASTVMRLLAEQASASEFLRTQLWERMHAMLANLAQIESAQAAVLSIDAALLADQVAVDSPALVRNLLVQALVILEEDRLSARAYRTILLRVIDALRVLERLEYDALLRLASQVAHQAESCWVPVDRCQALCAVANLYACIAAAHEQSTSAPMLQAGTQALQCWKRALVIAVEACGVSERAHLLLDVYRAGRQLTVTVCASGFPDSFRDELDTTCFECVASVQQIIRQFGWSHYAEHLHLAWARLVRLAASREVPR